MSLKLIYGRIGSGKTDFCMREALAAHKPVIYLVPEQFTFTAEQRICAAVNVHGLGGIEVFSFKRLAMRVLATAEKAAVPRLDVRAKAILLQKILIENRRDLKVLRREEEDVGTAGALVKLFTELKRYQITPAALRQAAERIPNSADKLLDIALLFEKYNERVEAKFADMDDDMMRLSAALLKTDYLAGREVYIDRFDGFDPSELSVIKAMLQTADRVTITLAFHPKDEGQTAFSMHKKMADRILGIAREMGALEEEPIVFAQKEKGNPELDFLGSAYFSYPAAQYEKKTTCVRLVTAHDPLQEVHAVARSIVKLCREKGYYYRDIAITARNIDMYERYIQAVLPTYEIPFFMDRKISILQHPFTVFVLSALETMLKGCSYDVMFRYIKSGFLRLRREAIDVLENYVLAAGIRGNTWKDTARWEARASVYSEAETEEEKAEKQMADEARRRVIEPLLQLETAMREGKTAAEKCRALYAFLEEMHAERRVEAYAKLFEKRGDIARAEEYRGVYNDLMDALDGVFDSFGDEKISVQQLYDILRVGLGEYETGIIPATLDGVNVGSVDRIKGYNIKALFVIGVVDGVFPASPERGGLLHDMDRCALAEAGIELPTAENKTILEEEHLIYKCLTMPSAFLSVSFPGADMDGGARRPSRICNRLREIFPKLWEENLLLGLSEADKLSVPRITMRYLLEALRNGSASEELCRAYGWLLENRRRELQTAMESLSYQNEARPLRPETVKEFFGNRITTSVSKLERQAACPFSFFATHILGAKERRIMQPGAADAGRFLHDFIDIFSERLRANEMQWQQVDAAYIDKEFEEIAPLIDRRINRYMLESSTRYAFLFTRLKSAVRASLAMLAEHMRRSRFAPLGYELTFGENGELAPLTVTLPAAVRCG
ncbi:MAG: PD-(D/E)XK nuclease family protein [Clostridia bacterium]|nr:PD-(D/E)XK nuclease family protein [Clostridia bacterium]